MKYIGELFHIGQKPHQWGLRGDEPLWNELAEKFADTPLPTKLSDFVISLETEFEASVGCALEDCTNVGIERFSFGGMSSGMVCGQFWRERGFPGLIHKFMLTSNKEYLEDERFFRWVFNVDWPLINHKREET